MAIQTPTQVPDRQPSQTRPNLPPTSGDEPRSVGRGVRRWGLVLAVGLLTACGSTAVATTGKTPVPVAATTAPTPAPPTAPLTVQPAFSLSDVDHLDMSGSSLPGAAMTAVGAYGTGGTTVTATADAQGNFTLHLVGLPVGVTLITLTASVSGYTDGTSDISVTRTISPAAYKASAASIAYNQLVKDPASLAGRVVTYSGQVFQYDTNTTTSHMIASVTSLGYGYWSDNVWLDVDPAMTANICKDTVVKFWGDVVGAYSYTTTNNGTLTIPEIHVQYISATQKAC
jgi:hypothetical protein